MSWKSGVSTRPLLCFLSKSKMLVEESRTRLLKQERPKALNLIRRMIKQKLHVSLKM